MELGVAAGAVTWWVVLVAAASMFVLGGIWYGALFARPWQALSGLSDEQVRTGTARVFGVAALASLVIAVVLALFIGPQAGITVGATAGLLAGLGWVAPAIAMTYAFERRPARLTLLDAAYHAVAFTVAGALLGWLG